MILILIFLIITLIILFNSYSKKENFNDSIEIKHLNNKEKVKYLNTDSIESTSKKNNFQLYHNVPNLNIIDSNENYFKCSPQRTNNGVTCYINKNKGKTFWEIYDEITTFTPLRI